MSEAPYAATALVWRVLIAALMPLRLRDVRALLGRVIERIRSYDRNESAHSPQQLKAFRRKFDDAWATAA